MLHATPHHMLSWDYTVYEADTPVAEVDLAWIRERGVVTIKEIDCEVYRESMAGAFVLAIEDQVLMRAEKVSFFSRSFNITYDDYVFKLKSKSMFSRAFVLMQDDIVVGTIAPQSMGSRKIEADLPGDLPLAVRVFILWLVIFLWKRAASSS